MTFVSAGQAPLHKKLTGAMASLEAQPSEATGFVLKEREELEEASNSQCGGDPCEPEKDDVVLTASSHCLVKMYDDYTEGTFKMNQVVEFVGILGFEPLQTIFSSGDGNQVLSIFEVVRCLVFLLCLMSSCFAWFCLV